MGNIGVELMLELVVVGGGEFSVMCHALRDLYLCSICMGVTMVG